MRPREIGEAMRRTLWLLGLVPLLAMLACEEEKTPPEIWIDISPVNVGVRSTSPDAGSLHFDLQITNRGDELLVIDSLESHGDQNCHFTFDGPDKTELGDEESAFIRGWYQPVIPAGDQMALLIHSNASNVDPLVVPICGRGLNEGDPFRKPPMCVVPPDDQPDCPDWTP